MSGISSSNTGTIPPPPRTLRRRQGAGRSLIPRLFILPFVAVGILAGAMALVTVAWALWGHPDTGQIVGKHLSYARKQTAPTYVIDGVWTSPDGRRHKLSSSIPREDYERLGNDLASAPAPLDVRVLNIGPWTYVNALPNHRSPWKMTALILVFALFWNLIVWLGFWGLYIVPRQHRRLLTVGHATPGTITEFKPLRRNSIRYTYAYRVGQTDYSQSTTQSQPRLPQPAAGSPVTVFYEPDNPWRSVVLEFSDYELADGTTAA